MRNLIIRHTVSIYPQASLKRPESLSAGSGTSKKSTLLCGHGKTGPRTEWREDCNNTQNFKKLWEISGNVEILLLLKNPDFS